MLAGVFFLFGQGRLHLCRSQPAQALVYYQRALDSQNQYRNLHHISFWEMAIANLALWDVPASLVRWRTLAAEASVCFAFSVSPRLRSRPPPPSGNVSTPRGGAGVDGG